MVEATLYVLSVLAAILVSLIFPGPVMPNVGLGFVLPLVLSGRIKESLILVVLIVMAYSLFSSTAILSVSMVMAIWLGGLVFAQRFLDQVWFIQGILAAVYLGILQYIFWAQTEIQALPYIVLHTLVNIVWFLGMLYVADNQRWYETLFE